ncbi:hypothetical protein PX554_10120 [Sphingomonas sp. H39-1-10]|uniref:hypothetical protein n=1 Tax=Sphingomonas pollutisoli TaxID=3030829 RepID=UPI0023B8A7CE|nr:hypothetical protein [Sphingomonas pollutisoli]MDF0488486.1 hypothetical protein [Sphingomonas pollutisoli]
MLFDSPLQLLVLCAVAVGAWLLGFATNPTSVNRDRMMRRLTSEFAAFRTQSQDRLNTLARHAAALEATHETMAARLGEAEARIAAFKIAGAASAQERLPKLAETEATSDAMPDALTRIDGIDDALAQRLLDLGITSFEDIEKLSDEDEMALELRLALPAGYVTGRQWRQQAATLRTPGDA